MGAITSGGPESNGNEGEHHITHTPRLKTCHHMQFNVLHRFQILLSNTNNSIQYYSFIVSNFGIFCNLAGSCPVSWGCRIC